MTLLLPIIIPKLPIHVPYKKPPIKDRSEAAGKLQTIKNNKLM